MKRIGVMGSSFNPPTLGHQDVIMQATKAHDEILLVPSLAHPFEKKLLPLNHRLNLLRLFLEDLSTAVPTKIFNIEASLQHNLKPDRPIYTFDVLTALTKYYQTLKQPVKIQFILGPDNARPSTWQKFYRFEDIEAHWGLWVAEERRSIRASLARKLIEEHVLNSTENTQALEKQLVLLLGEKVTQYILRHELFR